MAGLLALSTLTACELGDIEAAFDFALFEESADPEVQLVVEKQRQARALREAEAARRTFLGTGDPAQLAEALRLNPNDAELHAFAYALSEMSTPAAKIAQDNLLRLTGEQLRGDMAKASPGQATPAVDVKAVAKKATFTFLEAMARMATDREPSGGVGPPKSVLCGQYQGARRRAERIYGEQALLEHRATFGEPCR